MKILFPLQLDAITANYLIKSFDNRVANEFIEILYPYQTSSLTFVKRKSMSLYKQKINNKKINKLWKEDLFGIIPSIYC